MDTATSACSVALWQDGVIVQHRFETMVRGQAEALAPMIADILKQANVRADVLDLLSVTVGPGAFTGIRIGLATARGIALAANVPCLGLTTTEVIAHDLGDDEVQEGSLLVALDSKRSDVYVQAFAPDRNPITEPQAIEPETLPQWVRGIPGPVRIVGDASAVAFEVLENLPFDSVRLDGYETPDASVLAALAARRWSKEDAIPSPSPLYLRPPDAKMPRNGGRLRP